MRSVEFPNWFTGNSASYSIGPSVTLPIFLGGTNVARLDAAESRYQQMLESYQQTILLAFREVADLLVSLQARGEQLVHQRDQVAAATAAVGLANVRYRKGLVTYLDVIDAQRTMLAAETQLAQTERARLIDMVGLFKAVGGWMACRGYGIFSCFTALHDPVVSRLVPLSSAGPDGSFQLEFLVQIGLSDGRRCTDTCDPQKPDRGGAIGISAFYR